MVDNLEACKQQCIAYKGEGTCVLASFDNESPISEQGTCILLHKMNTPDVYLNVCKLDSDIGTTARCTVGKLYQNNIKHIYITSFAEGKPPIQYFDPSWCAPKSYYDLNKVKKVKKSTKTRNSRKSEKSGKSGESSKSRQSRNLFFWGKF
jgi:hypothetical protein